MSRADLRALQERLDEISADLDGLRQETAAVRPLLEDAQRLETLTEQVRNLAATTAASLADLQGAAAEAGTGLARSRPPLNTVQRADTLTYVSLYFDGGYNDAVRILVGAADPPTECVAAANTKNDFNSYAGAVVRPGEWWMAESKTGAESGFVCVATPLR